MLRVSAILLVSSTAIAHPMPVLRYDRTVDVRLTAAGVYVRYLLELNELSRVLDPDAPLTPDELQSLRTARPSEKLAERLYARKKSALLAERLRLSLDGAALNLQPDAPPELRPNRDHLEFHFRFFAPWPATVDRSRPLEFEVEDFNFESMPGKLLLTVRAERAITVHDLIEPGGLRGVDPDQLKPGDELKLRRAQAQIVLPESRAAVKPANSEEPIIAPSPQGLLTDLRERGLTALFDSDAGIGLLLLAALVFGAGHALTPGHGKTLVAAYLVGERGTFRHAVLLGLITTFTHTGSVLAIAIGLWAVYDTGVPARVQGWLQLGGGLLILIVGLWLLRQRIRGRADHVHLSGLLPDGGNSRSDGGNSRPDVGWSRVILLGIGGGLIPCWDAVMLLIVAISVGRLGFAIPMLLAFSAGLALVLIVLGLAVVQAHRAGQGRFGERPWFVALPVLSAMLLAGMGIWLARGGVQLLSTAAKG